MVEEASEVNSGQAYFANLHGEDAGTLKDQCEDTNGEAVVGAGNA